MKRNIETLLDHWKTDERRRPLLIRGARQVGKSFTIEAFGKRAFSYLLVVNFEQNPQYKDCFVTLNPREIVENLSILSRSEILPGQTLLFLDEIQECPEAIKALRYFYEQLPQLHLIAAGSLIEFALESENFSMPVGRIQYLFMQPLSFGEFLTATGETQARKALEKQPLAALSKSIHQHLIRLLKKYMVLGGMPAVIEEYVATQDIQRCFQVQSAIIQTYRDDFGKYASKAKHSYLQKVFDAIPKMVGNKFKYSHVDPQIQSRDLKNALELLEKAGVVYRVKRTSGSGVPLEVHASEKHFKTVFLDIGLMQNMCGLSETIQFSEDLMVIHAGALTEQFVGQELLAHYDPFQKPKLYYWAREARNSSAEVDYVMAQGNQVIPIEVKSGKTGTLRSMHLFLEQYAPPRGIKLSLQQYNTEPPITSVPLYRISSL